MVVEWMRVRVAPGSRDRFVEVDTLVWTPGLSGETGFLGKEVWLGEDETDLVLVIRWRSAEEWKGIEPARLEELERRFRDRFGEPFQVVEVRSYRPVHEVKAGVAERSIPAS
jgi:uncharacterized protein (TIGR03792 family)